MPDVGNKMKKLLQEKTFAVGTLTNSCDASLIEILAAADLDFVFLDTEHGPFDNETLMDLIRTCELVGFTPVVRIGDMTHKEIQRVTDAGAQAIVVPGIKYPDECRRLVDLAKFPPLGNRGFAPVRSSGYGYKEWAKAGVPATMAGSNERLLLLPQCETVEALEHIEEIVAIDGIDGIFIGPFDLSIAMGIPGEFANPDFVAAMTRIRTACLSAGKGVYTFCGTAEDARVKKAEGYSGVLCATAAAVLANAYVQFVNQVRA